MNFLAGASPSLTMLLDFLKPASAGLKFSNISSTCSWHFLRESIFSTSETLSPASCFPLIQTKSSCSTSSTNCLLYLFSVVTTHTTSVTLIYFFLAWMELIFLAKFDMQALLLYLSTKLFFNSMVLQKLSTKSLFLKLRCLFLVCNFTKEKKSCGKLQNLMKT